MLAGYARIGEDLAAPAAPHCLLGWCPFCLPVRWFIQPCGHIWRAVAVSTAACPMDGRNNERTLDHRAFDPPWLGSAQGNHSPSKFYPLSLKITHHISAWTKLIWLHYFLCCSQSSNFG